MSRGFSKEEHGSTTLCKRQSENPGSMPFSSLNRVQRDRQTAQGGACQQRIGLPEGAPRWLRQVNLTTLSETPRTFEAERNSSALAFASPCADRTRVLARPRRPCSHWQGSGQLEDGVPHAEALSPAIRHTYKHAPRKCSRDTAHAALADSALATTRKTSPM